MRRALGAAFVAAGAFAATTLVPATARADDETVVIVTVLTVGSALIGSDIAFTAYTGGKVGKKEEPAEGWMIAQSVLGNAQAVGLNVMCAYVAVEDKRNEGLALLPLLPAIWTGALGTFATWTLADRETRVDQRFMVSLLPAMNLAFTSSAIGYFAREDAAPYYISIPEATMMVPQAILTSIQAARDESGRPGWAALAAWSGVLSVHGIVSVIARAMDEGVDPDTTSADLPPAVQPTPPAQPGDPYYIDPAIPASPPAVPIPPPAVVPAPVPTDGGLAPGLQVLGMF